ncbi:ABC transporter substrate-binding protein [Bifidobacterium eulemuris]|uniref:ABC transporter substrate-binding protein n=1 Tax=Bifidobacterium eulemuris TaxID=1765219 RepID=A0A261G8E2_9BIFI|nr:ABC transporter substrate-binding protein [Bifidobacterium eulemuris]
MKNTLIKRCVAAVCALACVASLAACGAESEAGKIRIGIKFDQPGLGFKKSGTYVGFDVDVATYIARQLGYSRGSSLISERVIVVRLS